MTRVAVTGTPGCGKTTLCTLLREHGETVLELATVAKEHGAVLGHDETDDADVIDIDALHDVALPAHCYIDGHLAHGLPVDEIWVLRCDPAILRERLEARGYSPAKVQENWEAECMDLVLQEALEAGPRVVQRDGTRRSPEELLTAFAATGPAPFKDHDLQAVDWSERLLDG